MKNSTPLVDSAIAQQSISLDEKDLAILRLLQDNARITVKEIADQIHLSTTPVHERIKRLEANGVIKQYATLIDGTKVKKGLMVICYVSLNQHSKKSGGQFIKLINKRARCVLLLETSTAIVHLTDITKINEVEEIMVGLNDLHRELRLNNHFELLASSLMDFISSEIKKNNILKNFIKEILFQNNTNTAATGL